MLLLIIISSVIAQSPPPQESTKKEEQPKAEELQKKALALLDEVIKESQSLKLPENRILIQSNAANQLWMYDEKRARAIFKEVISSFAELTEKVEADARRAPSVHFAGVAAPYANSAVPNILYWLRIQLRQEIIRMLLRHDAKWGREFLHATSQTPGTAGPIIESMGGANVEAMMDMQFATKLAETEPEQAFEIAQENLDKVFSIGQPEDLINIMQKLQPKNQESAAKMAGDIMRKFRSADLESNLYMANSALTFLKAVTPQDKESATQKQPASQNNSPLLDEPSVKELVDMILRATLAKSKEISDDEDADDDEIALPSLQSLLPYVEKYAPLRAAALRAKIKKINNSLDPHERALSEITNKGEDSTADDYLRAAARVPESERKAYYEGAAQRATARGDLEQARQVVEEHITDAEQRKGFLFTIESRALANAVTEGKLETVRQMLAQVESPEERTRILSELAATIAAKGDKKAALQLIDEVRAMVGNQTENATQFSAQVQIAGAAASVDAAQGFEILEGMIDQINAVVSASAVLNGFENRQQFREGEMVIQSAGMAGHLIQEWSNDLQLLARTDFDRAAAAAERFQRNELRLVVRFAIIEGVLSDKTKVIESQKKRSGAAAGDQN